MKPWNVLLLFGALIIGNLAFAGDDEYPQSEPMLPGMEDMLDQIDEAEDQEQMAEASAKLRERGLQSWAALKAAQAKALDDMIGGMMFDTPENNQFAGIVMDLIPKIAAFDYGGPLADGMSRKNPELTNDELVEAYHLQAGSSFGEYRTPGEIEDLAERLDRTFFFFSEVEIFTFRPVYADLRTGMVIRATNGDSYRGGSGEFQIYFNLSKRESQGEALKQIGEHLAFLEAALNVAGLEFIKDSIDIKDDRPVFFEDYIQVYKAQVEIGNSDRSKEDVTKRLHHALKILGERNPDLSACAAAM